MTKDSYVPRYFVRPRPIRVAFLVEDSVSAEVTLDEVFANCHTRWGGRYSLVVPCENGVPRPAWLPWLDVYDPDIIYTYTDLDEAAVTAMHERFGPASLTKHQHYPSEKPSYIPELKLKCLTSLSVATLYARAHPASAPQPMLVVDYLPGQPRDRFVDDNFGALSGCFEWWPLPNQLADALRPITLASQELLAKSHHATPPTGETVPDTPTLLRYMADRPNSFGLAQLAADSAPRIDVRGRQPEAFTLIVGDSFADRVLFWNDRSLAPVYHGRGFTTLIVSPQRLDDEQFFDALLAFVRARSNISWSQPRVEVTSVTVSAEDLAALCNRFNTADQWNTYYVTGPTELDHAVPNAGALDQITGLTTRHMFGSSLSWRDFPAEGAVVRPPPTLPDQLQGVHSPSEATEGAWVLDLDIERQNNLSRFSNVCHKWRLPRRLRMHGAFCMPYQGSAADPYPNRHPRSTREGFLSVFTGFGEELPPISLPDDETAFQHALYLGRDWPPVAATERGARPSGPYGWSRPSDKGRYLIGVLRRFGGLQDSGAFLLHRYWKSVFTELGGAISADQRDHIKRTLKKRLRTGHIDSEGAWDRLAKLVAHEAHRVRMPLRVLSFDKLRARHKPFVEKEQKRLEERKTENPSKWIAGAQASLLHSVQWLCAHSVLYQGYERRCRTCYHPNWIHIGALKPITACEVCGTSQIAPVDEPWDFRLDGFLREALKEHGLLALVWCLIKLEGRAQQSFYFLGPHDLFNNYPDNNRASGENEIDLICVLDGKVHLCEVKSSSRDIETEPLVGVAKRIRPDVVTLAVLEANSQRLTEILKKLEVELAAEKITVELLTLADGDFWDSVYLHV